MNKATRYISKIFYFLPLCVIASFVSFFCLATIGTRSFERDCHDPASKYRFFDFCVHYAGAQIACSKDRALIYNTGVQQVYVGDLHGPVPISTDTLLMKSAPFLPCLLIPLAMLPVATAFDVYFIACLAAYFGGFYLLTRLRPDKPKPLAWLFLAWAFTGTVPVFTTALLGQISPFLFCLVAAYFYCLCRRRDRLAGVLLALSSFKPHYALFWALPALGLKRWQVIISAAISEILLLAMSIAILGWPAVAGYPSAIVNGDNIALWSDVGILMISLRGILFSLCNTPVWLPVTIAVLIAGELFLLYIWHRYKKSLTAGGALNLTAPAAPVDDFASENWPTYRWLFGATVILCLFCAAHAYVYDAMLLTIAGVFCVDMAWSGSAAPLGKSQKFLQKMLLATPYIQWIGMVILPYDYRRSLPTSLALMAMSTACIIMFRHKPGSAPIAAKNEETSQGKS